MEYTAARSYLATYRGSGIPELVRFEGKMMRFSLRPSAHLCVLCVEKAVNAEIRRDAQRTAEKPVFSRSLCGCTPGTQSRLPCCRHDVARVRKNRF